MSHPTNDLDLCFQVRNTTTGAVVAWCQATEPGRYEVRRGDGRAETHADRWSAVLGLARLVDDNPHPAAEGEVGPITTGGATAGRPHVEAWPEDGVVRVFGYGQSDTVALTYADARRVAGELVELLGGVR